MTYKFLVFANPQDATGTSIDGDFDLLRDTFEAYEGVPKDELPLFCATEKIDDTVSLTTDNCRKSDIVILDIDDSNYSSLQDVASKIKFNAFLYETASSVPPENLKYRLLVPLSSPVIENESYKLTCRAIAKHYGEELDPASNAIAHRYFIGNDASKVIVIDGGKVAPCKAKKNLVIAYERRVREIKNSAPSDGSPENRIEALKRLVADCPEGCGMRNSTLFFCACRFAEMGVEEWLYDDLASLSTLPDREKWATIRSAKKQYNR